MSKQITRPTRRQLYGLLFGPVLGDISEQVLITQDDGSTTTHEPKVWHEWFKGRILKGKSTTKLPDDKLHLYILEVQAFAATEMGVTFTEKLAPKEPPKVLAGPPTSAVDFIEENHGNMAQTCS